MNIESIKQFIADQFSDSNYAEAEGNIFFFHGDDTYFPFATIVTGDNDFDNVSNLNRADVYRLNIGIGKSTFQSLFDLKDASPGVGGFLDSGFDFTMLDKLMPHPMYGRMYWICILNPGEAMFQTLLPYFTEAYDLAVARNAKQAKKGN